MFNPYKKILENNNTFIYFEIDEFTEELNKVIDNRIGFLSDSSNSNLKYVKIEILNAILEKEKNKPKMGMIAEFFTQLFLDNIDFNSKYFFLNLEENSPKKGFDGIFVKDSKMWIMESKSGSIKSFSKTHNNKIRLAYKDLEKKISGKSENNPWKNAYTHAKLRDNNDSLLETIKKYKNEYYEEESTHNINQFNIIPSGTIFFNNIDIEVNIPELEIKIKEFISKNNISNSIILCISNKSIDNFIEYLKEGQ